MSRLADLHQEYADQNGWLQCLLGIVSETGRLAGSLPRPGGGRSSPAPPEIDPFVAALLGVLSLRAEIDAAARESTPRRTLATTTRVHPRVDRRHSSRLPRRPGDFMR
jgi:hypothetical protein